MNQGTMSPERIPNPPWLAALYIFELVSLVGLVLMGAFFTLIVSSFGSTDWVLLTMVEAGALTGCFVNMVIIGVALFKASSQPILRRFGVTHGAVALVSSLPTVTLFFGLEAHRLQNDWSLRGFIFNILFGLLGLGLPLCGLLLSRSERPLLRKIGVGISSLTWLFSSFLLPLIMIAAAVSGGMTV